MAQLRSILPKTWRLTALVVVWSAVAIGAASQGVSLRDGQREFFSARFDSAADLFLGILRNDSSQVEAHYWLVRSLLMAKRQDDAYKAAENALSIASQTAPAQTAAGLAEYRKGNIVQAEAYFHRALEFNSNYPGALLGMASICRSISRFKSARGYVEQAYRVNPDDPGLRSEHIDGLKGEAHIAALEGILKLLPTDSEQAQRLRTYMELQRVLDERHTATLTTPYQASKIKLFRFIEGTTKKRAVGVQVRLNGRQKASLLLDTGANGMSLTPEMAKKAGLEVIGSKATPVRGIGDKSPTSSYSYLASEIRIGDVAYSNYPISVFSTAGTPDFDGLIGADVFADFLESLDIPRLELSLTPRPGYVPSESRELTDSGALPAGYYRFYRSENHLAIPVTLDNRKSYLFLVDSGSTDNIIDANVARGASKVHPDDTKIEGIQGKVAKTEVTDRLTLSFAGLRQENAAILAIPLDRISDDFGMAIGGIIGMPILELVKVTLDYHEGSIRFEYQQR